MHLTLAPDASNWRAAMPRGRPQCIRRRLLVTAAALLLLLPGPQAAAADPPLVHPAAQSVEEFQQVRLRLHTSLSHPLLRDRTPGGSGGG